MKKKSKVSSSGMRVKTYNVLSRAVEDGIACGWRVTHKHTDTPGEDAIKEQVEMSVLNEICEWFEFEPYE